MKRVGNIFVNIYEYENVRQAIMKASLGKRDKLYVKVVLDDIENYIKKIQLMLKTKTYSPSPYTIKNIIDGSSGKERTIYMPRFYPDQIIHWALMLQIQSIIMRGMYKYNCGSVPGRGTSFGQKSLRKWLDSDRKNTKYCLKLDVKKFYPSINNECLKSMFRKVMKDLDCLNLIDLVIDSNQGLPIGNYTSQWFANFYLQSLDHFIKEKLKIKYYIRYVDDLVLLGSNKRKLHRDRQMIKEFVSELSLEIKENWQVFKVKNRPIDFLGFKFYQNKTTLRKRNALRIRRRISKINKKPHLNYRDACAVISYWGWVKRSDSYNFYHKYISPKISLAKARKVVSEYAKRNPGI